MKESKKTNEEEIESLKNINKNTSKHIEELENSIKNLMQTNEEDIKSLQNANESNFKLIEELENIIKDLKLENDEKIQELLKEFSAIEDAFNKEIYELNNQINRFQHDLSQTTSENEELKVSIIKFNLMF